MQSTVGEKSITTLCLKKRGNFETVAQNYNDRFWWNLAEIFKRPTLLEVAFK